MPGKLCPVCPTSGSEPMPGEGTRANILLHAQTWSACSRPDPPIQEQVKFCALKLHLRRRK